jgi:hypothetical protein
MCLGEFGEFMRFDFLDWDVTDGAIGNEAGTDEFAGPLAGVLADVIIKIHLPTLVTNHPPPHSGPRSGYTRSENIACPAGRPWASLLSGSKAGVGVGAPSEKPAVRKDARAKGWSLVFMDDASR